MCGPLYDPQIEIYLRFFQILTGNPLVYYYSVWACIELKPVHFTEESEDGGLDTFDFFVEPYSKSTKKMTMSQLQSTSELCNHLLLFLNTHF